jgi:hypothetical protein
MVFGYLYVPRHFVDLGDAAGTARRILEGAFLYRVTVFTSLLSQLLFVSVAVSLYELFEEVDRGMARFMVTLVCVGIAAELVCLANRLAPLVVLSGNDYFAAFTQTQRESLALGFLRLGGNISRLLTSIWGLWLVPFGLLTIRSGFLPKVLGYALIAAGVGYMGTCLGAIVFPDQQSWISTIMSPLYFGELPIIFWLAIRGVKTS